MYSGISVFNPFVTWVPNLMKKILGRKGFLLIKAHTDIKTNREVTLSFSWVDSKWHQYEWLRLTEGNFEPQSLLLVPFGLSSTILYCCPDLRENSWCWAYCIWLGRHCFMTLGHECVNCKISSRPSLLPVLLPILIRTKPTNYFYGQFPHLFLKPCYYKQFSGI